MMLKQIKSSMARAAMMQVANNAGKVDVHGRELGVNTKTLGLLATPSPAPGVDDSPLMTWGEIDGTPFRLDATDIQPSIDHAPTFKMPEVPYREKIAQSINDTIAKRYREKRRTAMEVAEKAQLVQMKTLAFYLFTFLFILNSIYFCAMRTPASLRFSGSHTPVSSMIRRPSASCASITDDLLNLNNSSDIASNRQCDGRANAGDFF
uniref:Uncharacterized protein n=1 Tax=Heterorhabditis bacteriophora TaxID=37862 RepID=A0A1I7XS81_HETBA